MLPGHPALSGKTPLNPPRHLPAAVTSLEAVIPAPPHPMLVFSPTRKLLHRSPSAAALLCRRDIKLAGH